MNDLPKLLNKHSKYTNKLSKYTNYYSKYTNSISQYTNNHSININYISKDTNNHSKYTNNHSKITNKHSKNTNKHSKNTHFLSIYHKCILCMLYISPELPGNNAFSTFLLSFAMLPDLKTGFSTSETGYDGMPAMHSIVMTNPAGE